ncbi:hypothetical protein ACFHWD_04465 [Clostridium sp. MT-14]|uniref:hypothetical protein n=1 Tax=Clostridium sp. MT-14 TaxID=3348360 RepID=UPI0035F4AF20
MLKIKNIKFSLKNRPTMIVNGMIFLFGLLMMIYAVTTHNFILGVISYLIGNFSVDLK